MGFESERFKFAVTFQNQSASLHNAVQGTKCLKLQLNQEWKVHDFRQIKTMFQLLENHQKLHDFNVLASRKLPPLPHLFEMKNK